MDETIAIEDTETTGEITAVTMAETVAVTTIEIVAVTTEAEAVTAIAVTTAEIVDTEAVTTTVILVDMEDRLHHRRPGRGACRHSSRPTSRTSNASTAMGPRRRVTAR